MFTLKKDYPAISFRDGARTVAANGDASVDLQFYEGALIIVASGTITDGTLYTFELKESTDDSTFTAVADADMVAGGPASTDVEPSFAAADDNHVHWFYYKGECRYIRVDLSTVTGSPSTGGHFIGIVVKQAPRHAPAV
jgi:hypothetical protein